MRERRVPTAQALLSRGRRPEQVDVVRRQPESRLVCRERLPVVPHHERVVRTQRLRSVGPVGAERLGPLRRLAGLRRQLGRGRAVDVEQRARPGELGPGRTKRRVERHRLLVEADGRPQTRRKSLTPIDLRSGLAFQEGVVRRQVAGRLRRQVAARCWHPAPRRAHWATCRRDVGLDLEHVGERGIERFLPPRARRGARPHVHQLGTHPHPAPPPAPFSHRTVAVSR